MGGIPLTRHSWRKGLENQREPETDRVCSVSVLRPQPPLSHTRSPTLPRLWRHKRADPFSYSNPRGVLTPLWKGIFWARTSTWTFSCSCIPTAINLQVKVWEEIFVSGFLCNPLSSWVLFYTKNGVISSIWHFLAAEFSSLGKDAQTTNYSSKLYLKLTNHLELKKQNLPRDKALSTESVPNHKVYINCTQQN